jgi:hypothetical protein
VRCGEDRGERRKVAARVGDSFESIADGYLDREGKELRTVEQRRASLRLISF